MKKEEAFERLFELLVFYSEERDQPVEKDFDFFREIKHCCEILELDVDVIKDSFKLNFRI